MSKLIGSNTIMNTAELVKEAANNLFGSNPVDIGDNLISQNDKNSVIINARINPCGSQKTCCVPKPKTPQQCPSGFIPSDDPDCACKPESRFYEVVDSTKDY